jgi:HD-GYP domain-containing protein (c-di-GMP phosphodiesterase class II)
MRLPSRAASYIAVLALLGLASLAFAIARSSFAAIDEVVLFAIFVILALLAEIYATRVPAYGWEISSSIAIYLAALFILGPALSVILVFLSSLLSELLLRWNAQSGERRTSVIAITFNVSQLVVTVSAAGLFLLLINHPSLPLTDAFDYALAIACFLIYMVLNITFVTGIVSLTEGKSFLHSAWESTRQFFIQYLVLCVSAVLLAVLRSLSVWHVFLALFPLTLVHVSFRGYVRLQTEARKTFEQISRLLDERDHYTAVHSQEVAALAVKIATEMDLPQSEIENIDVAARVHDIGKVAVPDSILLKPGPLNDEEWAIMKRHPVISAELIEGLEIYGRVVDAVRHEHERWDGSGYPDGLAGEEIPLMARIIAAADIHNALTTDRPYRKAFSAERTIGIIGEMRGTDLDPVVADALLRVISTAPAEAPAWEEIPAPAAEA